MKTLVIDTALPLGAGTPRQRAAHHLCRVLSSDADVQQVTIDLWETEFAARARMPRGQHLLTSLSKTAGKRPFLMQSWKNPLRLPSADEVEADLPILKFGSAKLESRVAADLQEINPDKIVIGDALLSPLIPWLSQRSSSVVFRKIAEQAAAWHLNAAARLSIAEISKWHYRLGRHLATATTGAVGDEPAAPPTRFPFDDVYLAKTSSVLVPASGFSWLDKQILNNVIEVVAGFEARSLGSPDIVLIGFAPALTRSLRGVLVQPDWQYLPGLAGAARAVLLPWLTPALASLADAFLSVGTPIILDSEDAAITGLAGREGVFSQTGGDFLRALAVALDPELTGPSVHEEICRAARCSSPETISEPETVVPLRMAALTKTPTILYNPLSGMLLVQLQYRSSSKVQEIRLIGPNGVELNRLLSSDNQKQKRIVDIEGGLVIDKSQIGAGVKLELHTLDRLVETFFVPVADFIKLEAEISAVVHDGAVLRGVFWTVDQDGRAAGWGLGASSDQARVSPLRAIEMPEVGGLAVPFEVPLPMVAGDNMFLWRRQSGPVLVSHAMTQRHYKAGAVATDRERAQNPKIAALRDRHRGARAWIIGNGPSVRLDDLARVPQDDVVFCFNRFHLSYGTHPVREDYVVSADLLMVRDFGQEMIDVSTGFPLFVANAETVEPLEGDFARMGAGDTYLPLFSMDPSRWVSVGGSSVFVALQMAHYMGIRDVILYGIDYSFTMNLVRDPRYPFPVSFAEGNHFITSYRDAKPWCPPTWRDISAGFLNARVVFELSGGRIVNATRGGRLETFPRADIDSVLARVTL